MSKLHRAIIAALDYLRPRGDHYCRPADVVAALTPSGHRTATVHRAIRTLRGVTPWPPGSEYHGTRRAILSTSPGKRPAIALDDPTAPPPRFTPPDIPAREPRRPTPRPRLVEVSQMPACGWRR